MIQPTIKFYGRLDYNPRSGKTAKYTLTRMWGDYLPMDKLKGRDSMVSMYLLPKREGQSSNCPQMHLQAKGSLNLSGLKDYFINGKLSGFAFGFPPSTPTYSSKNKPNPFFLNKEDGFLFIVHQDKEAPTSAEQQRPDYIEFLVLDGCKVLIGSYCQQLMLGGFDEILKALRRDSVSIG